MAVIDQDIADLLNPTGLRWYQVLLKDPKQSAPFPGVRVTARSAYQALTRFMEIVDAPPEDFLMIQQNFSIEEVPEEILNMYDLNREDELSRFIRFEEKTYGKTQ